MTKRSTRVAGFIGHLWANDREPGVFEQADRIGSVRTDRTMTAVLATPQSYATSSP